jgi:hypothetical protein
MGQRPISLVFTDDAIEARLRVSMLGTREIAVWAALGASRRGVMGHDPLRRREARDAGVIFGLLIATA